MQARFVSTGVRLDYTPSADVSAGDVILVGSQLGVASTDIPSGSLGTLITEGLMDVVKINEQQTAGSVVYWDADGNPYGGVAGTGGLTTTSSGNTPFGIVQATAGATAQTVRVHKLETLAATITVHETLSTVITDPGASGAIPVTGSGHVDLVTATAETRTIAAPTFKGQQLLVSLKTDGGDCTITVATTVNQTGNNTIVLGDAGDCISLVAKTSGANIRWSVVHNDGCALSTV
jgi:predicted RecA/RadA family phage recombinase